MTVNHAAIDEQFSGNELDRSIWFPYYLPHWSSRSESRATYALHNGQLHLTTSNFLGSIRGLILNSSMLVSSTVSAPMARRSRNGKRAPATSR